MILVASRFVGGIIMRRWWPGAFELWRHSLRQYFFCSNARQSSEIATFLFKCSGELQYCLTISYSCNSTFVTMQHTHYAAGFHRQQFNNLDYAHIPYVTLSQSSCSKCHKRFVFLVASLKYRAKELPPIMIKFFFPPLQVKSTA